MATRHALYNALFASTQPTIDQRGLIIERNQATAYECKGFAVRRILSNGRLTHPMERKP